MKISPIMNTIRNKLSLNGLYFAVIDLCDFLCHDITQKHNFHSKESTLFKVTKELFSIEDL